MTDVVQRADVRMIQRGDRVGFALEALAMLGVHRQIWREHFDGDVAVQARIARAIDFAHPARAERREDFVWAEARAGGQRHDYFGTIRAFNSSTQFRTRFNRVIASRSGTIMRKRPSGPTAYEDPSHGDAST